MKKIKFSLKGFLKSTPPFLKHIANAILLALSAITVPEVLKEDYKIAVIILFTGIACRLIVELFSYQEQKDKNER